MADYHFMTTWDVDAPAELVFDIITDIGALTRWWPSVYLDVVIDQRGDDVSVHLWTKGWLPYTLRWTFRPVGWEVPKRIVLDATGDFVGRGVWTFEGTPEGGTRVSYDWRVRAGKPLLRHMTWLLRTIFTANHRWAMGQGHRSLALEIRRRRASSEAERRAVPPPPQPTFPHNLRFVRQAFGALLARRTRAPERAPSPGTR